MKASIVLFDFNDTLIKTHLTAHHRNVAALKALGRNAPTYEEFLQFYSQPFPQCLHKWYLDDNWAAFMKVYDEEKKNIPYESIYEIETLIQILRKTFRRIGLVTNTGTDRFQMKANEANIDIQYFDAVRTDAKKPSPDAIQSIIQEFKIEPEDVVFVGDSRDDIEAASRANVSFIGVCTGTTTRETMLSLGVESENIFASLVDVDWKKYGFAKKER